MRAMTRVRCGAKIGALTGRTFATPVQALSFTRSPALGVAKRAPLGSIPYAQFHPIERLQRSIGNQGIQRIIESQRVRSKSSDQYKHEAERIAELTTKVPADMVRKCACGQQTTPSAESEETRKRNIRLERGGVNQAEAASAPIENGVLRLPGKPVPLSANVFTEYHSRPDIGRTGVAGEPGVTRVLVSVRVAENGLRASFGPWIHPRLSVWAPAWAERGNIYLGIPSLFLAPAERQRVLRHEIVHSLHQRLAQQSESEGARANAEELARRGEHASTALPLVDFLAPTPSLLGYPPQAYGPFDRVWIGFPGLLVEVVESGVAVHVYKTYDDLGTTKRLGFQAYECGKHDAPSLPALAKKMRDVARKTALVNAKIPASAKQRVALVAVIGDSSSNAYRKLSGKGMIILAETEFDSDKYDDTIAHEGSHAIFEFHSVNKTPPESPEGRVPDPLALRIADLYVRLKDTKPVPEPAAKYDRRKPPNLEVKGDVRTHPAGLIMVMDMLWAGAGGHPWQGVDEFFASAYGGFAQQPELLRDIVDYYQKADPNIVPLAKELFKLLATVGKPKALAKLKEPTKPEAVEALESVEEPPEESSATGVLGWLVDPASMPAPDKIPCPIPSPPPTPTVEELLEPGPKR